MNPHFIAYFMFTLFKIFWLGHFQHQCLSGVVICPHIPHFKHKGIVERLREATSPHKCPDLTAITC